MHAFFNLVSSTNIWKFDVCCNNLFLKNRIFLSLNPIYIH